jgi:hypothetical protein
MPSVVYVILIGAGFLLGLAIGRWWAILAGVAVGVWAGAESEVDEVSPEFLGTAIGLILCVSIGAGVAARRWGGRQERGGT